MTDRVRENTSNKKVEAPVQRKAPENVAANATVGAEPVGVLLQRAQLAPGTLSAGDGKRLQGVLGNQNPTAKNLTTNAPTTTTSAGATAATVQAKLVVGAANDAFEQEADRVADQVMQNANQGAQVEGNAGSAPSISRMTTANAQRAESVGGVGAEPGGAFEAGDDMQQQLSASRGGGSVLPDELRRKFEPAFGADFGGVRVHTGGDSAQMSDTIQAKAFTNGSDIHFNQGVYDPNSSAGQRLLAHELTHVVQQGAASQSPVAQRKADGNASIAVQRSPFGMIQRTSKKVSGLIAFWEEQKKLNAPLVKATGGSVPTAPPQPLIPSEHKYDKVGSALSIPPQAPPQVQGGSVGGGGADALPDLGPGSVVNMGGAPSFVAGSGGGGGSGGALHTPSGGGGGSGGGTGTQSMSAGAFQKMMAGMSTGVSDSSPGSLLSSVDSYVTPVPVVRPKPVLFPGVNKYKDQLNVDKTYANEMVDSTIFVMTKVFRVSSESDFFSRFDEQGRKLRLNDIGWTDEDITELEAKHKTLVHYVTDETERAEYVLKMGSTITQGASTTPYDTKDLYANGVGHGHAIFVMDPSGTFYAGRHKVGLFHHSSFLAGGNATSAGTLKVTGGKLTEITAKSGHYQPKPRQMRLALVEMEERGVSLAGVMIRTLGSGADMFKLGTPQPAQSFLDEGITPDPVLGSSSVSASASSSYYSSSHNSNSTMSTPSGGWQAPSSASNFDASPLWVLQGLSSNWEDKLLAMGLTRDKTRWSYKNESIPWSDLVRLLKGEVAVDQLVATTS